MIEMSWAECNLEYGNSIDGVRIKNVDKYLKLQCRRIVPRVDVDSALYASTDWSDWADIPLHQATIGGVKVHS